MRKIILYTAVSLDGKIARPDGSIDWLDKVSHSGGLDYGYQVFYDSVDTVIMGRNTYDQVIRFPGEYPYKNKKNYVFTHQTEVANDDQVIFVNHQQIRMMHQLKRQSGKDIWLVGGGQLNTFMLKNNCIDQIRLFVMPVILGQGINLFEQNDRTIPLHFMGHRKYSNGIVELDYGIP
ncbi:MAG: dihydrofolate reductase [Caldithrix sp.]|nr:dihydrofolate reductase [Caldithrix sp.]